MNCTGRLASCGPAMAHWTVRSDAPAHEELQQIHADLQKRQPRRNVYLREAP